MARTILLRIDPTATDASWQRVENGQLAGSFHQGKLADANRHCRGANVIVTLSINHAMHLGLHTNNRR